MACHKQLSISASASDSFTPLHTAVYSAASGTILGSMGNYIVEFNATTGAYIRSVKAISPMYGPSHLCLLGTAPYISFHADRSAQDTTNPAAAHINNDIFPVNTTTLLPGTGIGVYTHAYGSGNYGAIFGPRQFLQIGTRVFFLYPNGTTVRLGYIDKTNSAIWDTGFATAKYWSEQIATDGTYIYSGDCDFPRMVYYDTDLNEVDYSATDDGSPSRWPIACEWVTSVGKVHAVCADEWLVRVDNFPTSTNTYVSLETLIASVVTGIKPMRIRYNSVDGLCYIPVQNKDGIIVYDPIAITAVWKSGFSSPVDVVFTPSKAFAVQSSEIGIKEIT